MPTPEQIKHDFETYWERAHPTPFFKGSIRDRVVATAATQELAEHEATEREKRHQHSDDRVYGVIATRQMSDPPRTVDPWCVIERKFVPVAEPPPAETR